MAVKRSLLSQLLDLATPLALVVVAVSLLMLSASVDRLAQATVQSGPITIDIAADNNLTHHHANPQKHPPAAALGFDSRSHTPDTEPNIGRSNSHNEPDAQPVDVNTTSSHSESQAYDNIDVKPTGVVHVVEALNNSPDGAMVFSPGYIKIDLGDSITFKPTSYGHNSQTPEDVIGDEYQAIPPNAKPWTSGMNEEVTVTFTVPGIYLYLCSYHYVVGHVGVIQVGDDTSNLEAVKKAGQALKAKMFSNASRVDNLLAKVG